VVDAVIVATARTALTKSWRGAFNLTHGATLGGHVVRAAMERARLDPAAVEDVLMGCANPEGATGFNIARQIALRAGCPVTTAGMTVNRYCSSGLQTIALAAQRIAAGEGDIYVAGGVESISCVQNDRMNLFMAKESLARRAQARHLLEHAPDRRKPWRAATGFHAMTRIATASRASTRRGRAGRGPLPGGDRANRGRHGAADRDSGRLLTKAVTVATDEGIRADTNYEAGGEDSPGEPGRSHRGRQRQPSSPTAPRPAWS
jgi:acetyl-CoA C-acetyltransferase